jgi:hypothetical protein
VQLACMDRAGQMGILNSKCRQPKLMYDQYTNNRNSSPRSSCQPCHPLRAMIRYLICSWGV